MTKEYRNHEGAKMTGRQEKNFEDLSERELPGRKKEFDDAINLTVNIFPQTPIILWQPKNQAFVKNSLDSMLRKKYIQIRKLIMGVSLFLVPKKDIKQLVINYQKLNEVTERNFTPLSKINDTLNQLIRSQLFTKIDLKDAFNQMKIKEGNKQKMAFKTKYEIFEYLVMLFGLTNRPVTFKKYVN